MVLLQDHPQVMLSPAPESWSAMYALNIVRISSDGKRLVEVILVNCSVP